MNETITNTPLSASIPVELKRQLRLRAAMDETSMCEIVRAAIEQYLQSDDSE